MAGLPRLINFQWRAIADYLRQEDQDNADLKRPNFDRLLTRYKVADSRRQQVIDSIETPRTPGWRLYNDHNWKVLTQNVKTFVCRSDAVVCFHSQSALDGRRLELDDFGNTLRQHLEQQPETRALLRGWLELITQLKKYELRIVTDPEWYRIRAVLDFVLQQFRKQLLSWHANSVQDLHSQGVTPEGVLTKLELPVYENLLDSSVYYSQTPSLHEREHISRAGSHRSTHGQEDVPSSAALREDSASRALHPLRGHFSKRIPSAVKDLFRPKRGSRGGDSSAPANSLDRSLRAPLRHSVIYGDV
ncbi:hypothetical protein JCM16303_003116 [Sporobolomyces ruberrimus]